MEKVQEIINRLEKVFPDKLELNFSNPLELLVAVVLAAQATDKKVNEVTQNLSIILISAGVSNLGPSVQA